MSKSTEEAYDLLEKMATNNYQWSNERGMPKRSQGMYELDGINMLNAKVDSLVKMLGDLRIANVISKPVLSCDWCAGAHMSSDCQQVEQAQFVSNLNRNRTIFIPTITTQDGGITPISVGGIKVIKVTFLDLSIPLVFNRHRKE